MARVLGVRLRGILPEGRTLSDEVWARRHRGILVVLWAHAAFIPVFAVVRGFGVPHALAESAIVPLCGLVATTAVVDRRVRSTAVAIGLLTSSAVLVHLSGGVIETHFHFFVMVAVVALYQDWVCFLVAIAYVLVHHGVFGAVAPDSVFNHYAALNQPWKWAAIHAFFIAGISAACLVTWRLDENLLERERQAEERLRQEKRLVETLNEVGRAVAAELDLKSVLQRVTDAATDLTSAAFGAFFYNVVGDGADEEGGSYTLHTPSGPPYEAFAHLPIPGATGDLGTAFAGDGAVRLDDVTTDPQYGHGPPNRGTPEDRPPVRSYLAVPVRSARGEVLGGLCLGHPEPGRFTELDERLAVGIAAHAAVAIDNARLYEGQRRSRVAAEAAERRLDVLADASRALASSLELHRILEALSAIVVSRVADGFAVLLIEGGWLQPAVVAGQLAPLAARDLAADPADLADPLVRALATGEGELVTRPSDLARLVAGGGDDPRPPAGPPPATGHSPDAPVGPARVGAAVVVPLRGTDAPLGVLVISAAPGSERVLAPDDVSLAEELARRAAVAVEHARLYAGQRSAAETLQHSLLPDVLPDLPGVEIAGRYLPGGPDVDVGGDWYDVLALPDGNLALAMGDVVGRGVPAASLMGQLRNGLRAYLVEGRSPSETLSLLNRLLRDIGSPHHMATLVVMLLDPETGALRYSNAGHPPPVVRPAAGRARLLEEAVGVPLGALGHTYYREAVVALEPGDTILLFTDGLVEDRSMPLDEGLQELQEKVSTFVGPLDDMCQNLTAGARQATRSADDVALLGVRWLDLGPALDLQVASDARVLRPLRGMLRRWLAGAGVGEQEAYEVLVATCEACTNAIRHGSPQAAHFGLRAELDGELTVSVRSEGRWRNRRATAPGGRGLDIIRQFMDETEVDSHAGFTQVRMRRQLAVGPAADRQVVDAG